MRMSKYKIGIGFLLLSLAVLIYYYTVVKWYGIYSGIFSEFFDPIQGRQARIIYSFLSIPVLCGYIVAAVRFIVISAKNRNRLLCFATINYPLLWFVIIFGITFFSFVISPYGMLYFIYLYVTSFFIFPVSVILGLIVDIKPYIVRKKATDSDMS